MNEYLKATGSAFLRYRHLLGNLVRRDISIKYRRSALGWLWSILNPLLMMTVMVFVFQNLFTNMAEMDKVQVVSVTGEPPKFAVYLLSGQLIFNFFSEATNLAMDSVLGNAGLLKKVYIPKYIFPLEKVLFSLVNTLFSFISLVIVILATRSPITAWVALVPLMLVLLFIFNFGVGMVLSSLVIFFRDVKHLYGVVVLALTYLTPIFYSVDQIIAEGSAVRTVMKFNPMYWFVDLFRQLVVFGAQPPAITWLIPAAWAVGTLVLGLIIFRKTQDRFILYI